MEAQERFLVDVDLSTVPLFTTRCLVIGTGIAGLSAALAAAKHGSVLLTAKTDFKESNTTYAQGGIAAALADDDSVELHVRDTLDAGSGLCDEEAVRLLVTEGRDRCRELIEMGVEFDRENGEIAFTAYKRPDALFGKARENIPLFRLFGNFTTYPFETVAGDGRETIRTYADVRYETTMPGLMAALGRSDGLFRMQLKVRDGECTAYRFLYRGRDAATTKWETVPGGGNAG